MSGGARTAHAEAGAGAGGGTALDESNVLHYELPKDFDVKKECREAKDCDSCAFFCASPCARAYWRSVNCFEHYKPKVGVVTASADCRWYAMACQAQHAAEMDRLDEEWEARKGKEGK
uniref:Uncharacterized protein n=1 Tax=Bicosoecida sp. CB-2014 TaxID=1486930 RepID=A0A7S1CCX2_9STRA|mmetsp:Transcript_20298/g.71787  ORF Transcript_20298/g.71787 Transcript_20298/m.71787 type:complete len:118 (+) Transcript_20298:102-455(+)